MDEVSEVEAQAPSGKKRRIPKACAACRRTKLRCDESRPCSRCYKAGIECIYFQKPKDPTIERLEYVEHELSRLRGQMSSTSSHTQQTSPLTETLTEFRDSGLAINQADSFSWVGDQFVSHSQHSLREGTADVDSSTKTSVPHTEGGNLVQFSIRKPSDADVVSKGAVSESDARTWFSAFFEGCDRFVPVFDPRMDTFESLRRRSSILFDVIIVYGARAAHGAISRSYRDLYCLLRQHTSDLILGLSNQDQNTHSIEAIQALLVIASYSDSGAVLCDVTLRAVEQAGIPAQLNSLFSSISEPTQSTPATHHTWFTASRVWLYLYVLDMILSLDGGKPPSMSLQSSPRRVRALLAHPYRTPLDLRLFAQVELNALRISAHESITMSANSVAADHAINSSTKGGMLDLDLWLSEWQGIVSSDTIIGAEYSITDLNLRIQHAWATLTLHLRALTASGIENIALMTDSERHIALAAKAAAERHLQLLLTKVNQERSLGRTPLQIPDRPYVANFRYAMAFVWAKNVFCVLIVLRLGILLGDPPDHLMARLTEANEFLHELEKVGMGANLSYTRILAKTVQKCEAAVNASLQYGNSSDQSSNNDFQSFIPKEFMFEWDFPGLNLCYIPIDWQDLFLDFGGTA